MISLLALAAAIFVSQTGEFLPGGLVPLIADDLGVRIELVGQMVTVFAFTVVIATTPLALVTRKLGRKPVVMTAFLIVCAGNAAVGLAPTFEWAIGARVVGALAHGLFWAVVATYAVEIAPVEKLGRAVAITAAGGSLSGILGIPIGNALGQAIGWRSAFLVVAAVGLGVAVILWRWLPPISARVEPVSVGTADRPRRDATAVGVAMVCVLILLVVVGQTSFGPYTTAWLELEAGFDRAVIPVYLLITGVAGAAGVIVAGHVYDRFPRAAYAVGGLLVAVGTALFPLAAQSGFGAPMFIVAICVSFAFAGLPSMLQARMMRTASPRMRTLAGAVQTTAFNVGIGGGALVGGLLIAGVGIHVLPLFAAVIGVLAIGCTVIWDVVEARVVLWFGRGQIGVCRA